jgi:CheY-like chemotaxis protein
VEDEEPVRRLLTHILRHRGYRVIDASGGEEALALFDHHGDSIQLLLTDMVMPKMSGRELCERLRALRPNLKVVFMSGYTDDILVRTGGISPGMSFLQKPLRPDTLTAAIRAALDSPSLPFNPR